MDNLYRLSEVQPYGALMLRGRWEDDQTFVADYPYDMFGLNRLGELGETELRFKFTNDLLEVTIVPLIFGGEPVSFSGER